jgi:hypothetical protein
VNEKRTRQLHEATSTLLRAGEEIEVASFANVGSVSIAKNLAVMAIAGIVSGGAGFAMLRPKRLYLLLTNQRLLFVEQAGLTGRPTSKFAGEVPRDAIAGTTAPRRGVTTTFDMVIRGRDKGLRLVFPRPMRDDGDKVAASLGALIAQ